MGSGKGTAKRIKSSTSATDNKSPLRHVVDETSWWEPDGFTKNVEAPQMSRKLGINEIISRRVLKERFATYSEYSNYLQPTKKMVRSPEKTVEGMKAAGEYLSEQIKNKEKIAIFGDYDPDGTCGVAAMISTLRYYGADNEDRLHLGFANARDGFGLREDYVREAHKAGAKTLITIDCGSTQVSACQLAKDLGMKVIVVDHHDYDENNPCDWHLNPKKHEQERGKDLNTGAQLGWKLGASIQMAMEDNNRPREEYWKTPMFLAGVGCRADMYPMNDPENRAFFRVPMRNHDLEAPPGLQILLEHFDEDLKYSSMIRTAAAMNMSKRTTHAYAGDVVKLLTVEDPVEAKKVADKIIKIYDIATPIKDEMAIEAKKQAKKRKNKEEYFATAVIDDKPDYAGYSGILAGQVAREEKKPACVFNYKGKDEFGQDVYKFSLRNGIIKGVEIGEDIKTPKGTIKHAGLIHDQSMLNATKMKMRDEHGDIVEGSSLGGHSDVVSGSCTKENIPRIRAALTTWGKERESSSRHGWYPKDKSRNYLTARNVSPEEFHIVEEEAKLLQPYGTNNFPLKLSMKVKIKDIKMDDETQRYKGTMILGDGSERKAIIGHEKLVRFVEEKWKSETPEIEACFNVNGMTNEEFYISDWLKLN